jgi:TolA-binding protein
LRLAACGFLLCAACAHAPPPVERPEREIKLDPVVVTAAPRKIPVEGKSDVQLFDDGSVLFRAGDFAEAAQHFDYLFSRFPNSPQVNPALYNAGLAHERLLHFTEALDRFIELSKRAPDGEYAVDAAFHAALAEYKLGKKQEAAERLSALAGRPGLPPQRKGEALIQIAVCRFELGARSEAERLLRQALQIFDKELSGGGVDPALPAQAEFWIGETYRSYFRDAPIDPQTMDEAALAAAMETKAQFLLSAQGHYLRAIRRGEGEWATAAGFRIGELYEAFHDSLVNAPLPKGLDAEQAGAYRRALRERVRVLVSKAIQIYEQTLSNARRVGAQNDYVDKAQEALERVKKLLLADEPSL